MAASVPLVADVVIAGAGALGLAAARHVRAAAPGARLVVVTAHPPMGWTSAVSSECFRDHWPSPVMRAFMGRSVQLQDAFADATGDAARIQRRGYLYVSDADDAGRAAGAEAAACHGADVRTYQGGLAAPGGAPHATGADVYADGASLRAAFPFLSPAARGGLHVRNAGWLSAHTQGVTMLDALVADAERGAATGGGGARFALVTGTVDAVDAGPQCDAVRSVRVAPRGGGAPVTIACGAFVNATGPFLGRTHGALLGAAAAAVPGSGLPVFSEVHAKVVFRDTLRVLPRDAPMTICNDAIELVWTDEERAFLAEAYGPARAARLAARLPPGAHFRPYGGDASDAVLMLWEAWHEGVAPGEPPPESVDGLLDTDLYPEVALRGLARLVPDLAAYFDEGAAARLAARRREGGGGPPAPAAAPRPPTVDGGYYTKTAENLPLVGPAPGPGGVGAVRGAFVCGAASGYGIMASHAAGELLAAHVTGASALPPYARLLSPLRYQDDAYTRPGGERDAILAAGGGQL